MVLDSWNSQMNNFVIVLLEGNVSRQKPNYQKKESGYPSIVAGYLLSRVCWTHGHGIALGHDCDPPLRWLQSG